MLELYFHFGLVLALASVLAALVIAAPARIPAKVFALVLATGLSGTAYLAGSTLLGQPKPTRLALLEGAAAEATIVGSLSVEDEAIYLWLMLPEAAAPRAYRMPWSVQAAEALGRAQAEAESNGTRARMRSPFRGEAEGADQQFYAPPPPPMPPKS